MGWPYVFDFFHIIGLTAVTESGRLVVAGPVSRLHPRVIEAIGEHRDTLVTILVGGHTWAPCSRCGQGLLLAVRTRDGKTRTVWPKCRLTPRCPGSHIPRPAQVAALVAAGVPVPPAEAPLPAKPDRRRFVSDATEYPTYEGEAA